MTIEIKIAYLIGVIAAYLLTKFYLSYDRIWTRGLRFMCMLMSLGSWATCFASLIAILIISDILDNDKPAKW